MFFFCISYCMYWMDGIWASKAAGQSSVPARESKSMCTDPDTCMYLFSGLSAYGLSGSAFGREMRYYWGGGEVV